jgi:predicted ATPase
LPRIPGLGPAIATGSRKCRSPVAIDLGRGAFELAAAREVLASDEVTSSALVDGLSSLVAKSLVTAEIAGAAVRYRLLDTTRIYALEKLGESGERETIARRHAEYYLNFFARAEDEAAAGPSDEWLADYAREIDNLRASLDRAFSPEGDGSIGVALTAAAVPLWMRLSLLKECRSRAKQALRALETAGTGDTRGEMRLHAALAGVCILIT